MAADALAIMLPGDEISQESLPKPTGKKKTLTLGPGLRHIPPSTVASTIAGALVTDNKKCAAWVESDSGRYNPQPSDLVIATIHSSTSDAFTCTLTPHTPPATLPHLSFENASKKTRPHLPPTSLVYARILSASPSLAPELTCVDPSTGKAEGLGPLRGGMVFGVGLGMARRLLAGRKGGVVLLEQLGEKIGFEIAVGRNGVVVVDAGSVRATLAIGRAVQEVDALALGEKAQRKLAERVLRSLA